MIDIDSMGFVYLVSAACFECTQVSGMYRWPWAGIQTSNWPDSRGLWNTWTFSPIMNLPPLYFATIQSGKRSLLSSWSATDSFATYTCVMDIARSRWFWFVRYLRRDCCSEVLNSLNLRSPRCTWKAFSHYINQIGAASINSKSMVPNTTVDLELHLELHLSAPTRAASHRYHHHLQDQHIPWSESVDQRQSLLSKQSSTTRRKKNISEKKTEEIIEFEFCKRSSSNQITRTSYNDIISGLSGQPTDVRNETLKHNNVLPVLIPEGDQE